MKISKIKAICKERKRVDIYHDAAQGQWIGNGSAIYAAHDLPYVEEETVPALFELSESEAEKWCISEFRASNIGILLRDGSGAPVTPEMYCIEDGRGYFRPVFTTDGPYLLLEEYMKPLEDEKNISLEERKDSTGTMYLAVKRGLFLRAVIKPTPLSDALADKLKYIWQEHTKAKLRSNPVDLTHEEPEQTRMEGMDENEH